MLRTEVGHLLLAIRYIIFHLKAQSLYIYFKVFFELPFHVYLQQEVIKCLLGGDDVTGEVDGVGHQALGELE